MRMAEPLIWWGEAPERAKTAGKFSCPVRISSKQVAAWPSRYVAPPPGSAMLHRSWVDPYRMAKFVR
jgi:hypothetical protein